METLNKFILEAIEKLNAYQGKGYLWPSNIDGSIGDVMYKDKVILHGNSFNHTYCCGLTLQAYIMACNAAGKDLGSYGDVMKIRSTWFIASAVKDPVHENKGPVDALVPRGFGIEVPLAEAQPGDLVQLWRKNGSGHSVIFIERDGDSFYYWSTQKSTNGIGYRFEGVPNPVTHTHICRPLL
jgi:hypothetical protein